MPRPVTDTFPDFTGHLLDNGRFKLIELLGSGAYGKVYKAFDLTSTCEDPKYYAVKCLLKPKPGSREEEFQLREFALHRLISASDHPNIVSFHNVFYEHTFVYVILDLCSGGDLFGAITERKVFCQNTELIKSVFVQLLDAVHHCHENGIYHRDLKPENILFSKDGRQIYLADFGLSTQNKVSEDFGCGSSYYMSPECIGKEFGRHKFSTRHSDVWSLGVILTNMIAGRNPWRYAMTIDDCFSTFLYDRDFLRTVLPISDQANFILKRIFHLNPLNRISIPELRREIIAIDSFFMSEDEIDQGGDVLRAAAANYAAPPAKIPVVPAKPELSKSSSYTPQNSEEVYLYARPTDGLQPLRDHPHNSLLDVLAAGSRQDVTSSEPESAGPITPESRPINEPLVNVPVLSGDVLGGGSNVLTYRTVQATVKSDVMKIVPTPRHRAPSNTATKPPPRRVGKQLLRKAVQVLKALSESVSS
ncbi:serine/threonine protein kinase, negative regulator of sexual conjugation and meiosis [Lentinula raphanica]|nr:serine/threonine protein kinase, negative regulator of sexual conjugation and meiosis [Lentinula raphanica]